MATMTKYGRTIELTETGTVISASMRGSCDICGRGWNAGDKLAQYTDGAKITLFGHDTCPTTKTNAAAQALQSVGFAAPATGRAQPVKVAKFYSHCPECGSLIEPGKRLWLGDSGRYISDCCL